MKKQELMHLNGLMDEIMYDLRKDTGPDFVEAYQRMLEYDRRQYANGQWVAEVHVHESKDMHQRSVQGKAELITEYMDSEPENFRPVADKPAAAVPSYADD